MKELINNVVPKLSRNKKEDEKKGLTVAAKKQKIEILYLKYKQQKNIKINLLAKNIKEVNLEKRLK